MTIEEILHQENDVEFAIALSNLVFARCEQIGFTGLTPAEQVVYCIDALEREVNNGGFNQFFLNSAGDHACETVLALRQIGAEHTAGIIERAIALFPNRAPAVDREVRWGQVDAFNQEQSGVLEELDGSFYEYRDNLTVMLRRFVEENQASFSSMS